jgi:hypothetical protein
MSGGSIWASLECQFCFWIAGGWVSYLTMRLLTLQLFKNSIDTQEKLRSNLHSLSASELLEYRRIRTVTTYKLNKEVRHRDDSINLASFFTFFLCPYQRSSTQNWPAYYHCPCLEPLRQDQLSQLRSLGAWVQILTLVSEKPKTTMVADLYVQEIQKISKCRKRVSRQLHIAGMKRRSQRWKHWLLCHLYTSWTLLNSCLWVNTFSGVSPRCHVNQQVWKFFHAVGELLNIITWFIIVWKICRK